MMPVEKRQGLKVKYTLTKVTQLPLMRESIVKTLKAQSLTSLEWTSTDYSLFQCKTTQGEMLKGLNSTFRVTQY